MKGYNDKSNISVSIELLTWVAQTYLKEQGLPAMSLDDLLMSDVSLTPEQRTNIHMMSNMWERFSDEESDMYREIMRRNRAMLEELEEFCIDGDVALPPDYEE